MRPDDQRRAGVDYTVVPRTLVFLTRGDDVLLLKGAPHKRLWAGKYNGVGGHLEPGESPHSSALREVREETGLTVDMLELRAVIHVTLPQPPGVVLFVFVGEAPDGDPRASEEGTPVWIASDALSGLPLVEDLPELLPRLLSPSPSEPRPVLFATYHVDDAGLKMVFE
jgi:8-oxo-dGTP diphosphatase